MREPWWIEAARIGNPRSYVNVRARQGVTLRRDPRSPVRAEPTPEVARALAHARRVNPGGRVLARENLAGRGRLEQDPRRADFTAGLTRQRVGQIPAGIAEITVAPSQVDGEYRPAILDLPAALVGTVQTLATGRRPGMDTWQGRGMTRQQLASERTNEFLGIDNPQNTDQTVLRILPQFGIPSSAITTPLRNAATLTRGVEALRPVTRGVDTVVDAIRSRAAQLPAPVRTAGRTAGRTARATSRLFIPLRQGGIGEVGVGTALGTGITEALDAGAFDIAPEGIAGYTGVTDTERQAPVPDASTEEILAAAEDVPTREEYDEGDALEAAIQAALPEDQRQLQEQESYWEEAAIGLGAILGGRRILPAVRRQVHTRIEAAVAEGRLPDFVGRRYVQSRGSTGDRVTGAIVQQDQPIRSAADAFLSRDQVRSINYRSDRINNAALGARVRDWFTTGRMPGTSRRGIRIAAWSETFARELTPQQQQLVRNAAVAASALDDIRATGTQAALNLDRLGLPTTVADLERLVSTAMSEPQTAKYVRTIQQGYKDLLRFELYRGLETPENFKALRERRPHYVRLAQNLERDVTAASRDAQHDANADIGIAGTRATTEGAGVQGVTGVADPFALLWSDMAATLRRAELNDIRRDAMRWLSDSGAMVDVGTGRGRPLIERVRGNRDDGPQVHTVWENGRQVKYKVNDPAMSEALKYRTRASAAFFEDIRQFKQSTVTGGIGTLLGSGFAILRGPIYDAFFGAANRAPHMRIGQIDRMLGAISQKVPRLGSADPTVFGSTYVGAVGYMWDGIKLGMAQRVASHMIRENSWLRNMLGDGNTRWLEQRFAAAYEASTRAEMDAQGVTSMTMHSSPDPHELLTGVENISPHFARTVLRHTNADIYRAVLAGDLAPLRGLLSRSRNAFAATRSRTLARQYGSLLEAMNNGFRYNAYRSNRSRAEGRLPQDPLAVEQLNSEVRRMLSDPAQFGSNIGVQRFVGTIPYSNVALQATYELGKTLRRNPTLTMANIAATLGTAWALQYAAFATQDEDAIRAYEQMSAAERTRTFVTFGGMQLPMDPLLTLIGAPAKAILDHISGYDDGEYNPDLLEAIDDWISGDESDEDEQEREVATRISLREAWRANNILDPSGFPLTDPILSYFGIDPQASRMEGSAVLDRAQDITGVQDQDSNRVDSIASASWERMIVSVFGSAGRGAYDMVDETYRALGQGAPIAEALERGGDRWTTRISRSPGVVGPVIFGNQERVRSIADENFEIARRAQEGVERALAVAQRDIRSAEVTGSSPRSSRYMAEEEGIVPPEVRGTELETIASYTRNLDNRWLRRFREQIGSLQRQARGVSNQYLTTQEQRARQINEANEEVRYLNSLMVTEIRAAEQDISQLIGRPFTYDGFDPEEYMRPRQAPQ